MARRPVTYRPPGADYQIQVLGAKRTPLSDVYHAVIRLPWWAALGMLSAVFLVANAAFAGLYLLVGGIAHAEKDSFFDAFSFSVQTMGTIGYGAMFPDSVGANVLVVAESITGLILTALGTGMVFAKFSQSNARLVFTRHMVISPMDGAPTLRFRVGNERANQIVDAHIRLVLVRTERHIEGSTFYRMVDLPLMRERALSLTRSWLVGHVIDAKSPLYGVTPEQFVAQESEIQVLVIGLDDATHQMVHGTHQYFANDVLWGARHVDILSEPTDGTLTLDLTRFHDTEPSVPTADFPYPVD